MARAADKELSELLGDAGQDELWLISYADLLTLLIGFFVLLLAASPMKLARFERLAASLSGKAPPPLAELQKQVEQFIVNENLKDQVLTREDAEGLNIEFKDALLFDSASASIRTPGQTVLTRIAGLVKEIPGRQVAIEGYTDEVPIATSQFHSNWELSSQRAINVRNHLEQNGVDRGLMSVRGYADTRRLDLQGTVDVVRAANRRVVIRVE